MKIIATIDNGFLIEATTIEVKEILRSVQGNVPEKIEIGQKIPAIDYAATITKLKKLPEDFEFRNLISHAKKFNEAIDDLAHAVNKATEI